MVTLASRVLCKRNHFDYNRSFGHSARLVMDFKLGHTYSSHHVLKENTLQTLQDEMWRFRNINIMTWAGPLHHWLQIHLVRLDPNFWVSSGLLPITPPVLVSLFPNLSFLSWGPLQPLQTRP